MSAIETIRPVINLDPVDWQLATWRPYIPLPRPPIRAFDQQTSCNRLSKSRSDYYVSWKSLQLSPVMSREEAHFWLVAMAYDYDWQHKAKHAAAFLAGQHFDGNLTIAGIEKWFEDKRYWRSGAELIIPLTNLLPLHDLISLINRMGGTQVKRFPMLEMVAGFREYVLPYLTPDEKALVRELIREQVANAPAVPANSRQQSIDFNLYIAALVGGFSQQIAVRLAVLPDNFYRQQTILPYMHHFLTGIDLIFGLDDPALVERETRRLGHWLCQPHHVAGWLAHTETRALDWIYDSILNAHKDVAEPNFKVFTKVEDEAVVPYMLRLQHDSPVVLRAVAWLRTHPEIGAPQAASLLTADNSDQKTRREAHDYLLSLKRSGHENLLQSISFADYKAQLCYKAEILDYAEEILPPFTGEDTPEWVAQAVSEIEKSKRAKLPAWLDAGDIAPLRLHNHSFNRDQMYALLIALSRSTLDAPQPFVTAVKTHVEKVHQDQFAWSLFELWLDRGAPGKDKWAMLAVGLLGGDASVMRLTPLIRKWPGESQHQRATTGLACLRAIGTDTALTQINNIGQKVQFKALKEAARNAIEAIAAERGMSREELADRIVPDCGLDADGRRTFNYGSRPFTLALNSDLKPVIVGEDGKLKPDLPKPTAQDDPDQVSIAQADWKLIKKQVRDVAKAQAERLESAMMSRRMWKPEEFRRFLVNHPLMIHLVRSLVWGGYGEDRKLTSTFRVTDEKDYANVADDPITIEDTARIGLVHPLQLSEAEIAAWGQILSDYDRVPPFTQLGRKTYALNPDEKDATEITRYAEHKIPAVVLIGVLQKLGWTRGVPGDGGGYYEHSKPFYEDGVTAVVQYPGVSIGYLEGADDQAIERCFFASGIYKPDYAWPDHKNRLKLGSIDPVVMSEVLRDLALLAHKSGK